MSIGRTEKPCPFCQNPNASEEDIGGACCFCDYEGVVTVGKNGTFSNITQYDKVYFATNHEDRLDELHGRNDSNRETLYDLNLEHRGSEIYFDMRQVANICQIKINGKLVGRNELFKLLRKKKVLQEGNNLPYKKFVSEGYFEVKKLEIEKPEQYLREGYKTLVTQSGLEFIKTTLNQ